MLILLKVSYNPGRPLGVLIHTPLLPPFILDTVRSSSVAHTDWWTSCYSYFIAFYVFWLPLGFKCNLSFMSTYIETDVKLIDWTKIAIIIHDMTINVLFVVWLFYYTRCCVCVFIVLKIIFGCDRHRQLAGNELFYYHSVMFKADERIHFESFFAREVKRLIVTILKSFFLKRHMMTTC